MDKEFAELLDNPVLYLDFGKGFSENCKINAVWEKDNDCLIAQFDLSSFDSIVRIRFNPIEGSNCKLELLHVSDDKLHCSNHNASYVDNNKFIFLEKDPYVVFSGAIDNHKTLFIKYRLTKFNDRSMLADYENSISELYIRLAEYESQLVEYKSQLELIRQSKAWKLITLLRRIKQPIRNVLVNNIFKHEKEDCVRKKIKTSDIKSKIAIQVHIFFVDLCEEIIDYLNKIPYDYDCFISTDSVKKAETITKVFRKNSNAKNIELLIGANRGRDVGLFLVQMNNIIFNYNYFCHIHTKKSKHTDFGDGWRRYLLDELLGSKEKVMDIIQLFDTDNKLGIIFPKTFSEVEKFIPGGNNTNNRIMLNRYFKLINVDIQLLNNNLKEFPVGDMFWGRSKAFTQVFSYPFTVADFPKETGQLDQTIMHGIERSWVYIAEYNSYHYKVLNI